jgi:hypothetical protein
MIIRRIGINYSRLNVLKRVANRATVLCKITAAAGHYHSVSMFRSPEQISMETTMNASQNQS